MAMTKRRAKTHRVTALGSAAFLVELRRRAQDRKLPAEERKQAAASLELKTQSLCLVQEISREDLEVILDLLEEG